MKDTIIEKKFYASVLYMHIQRSTLVHLQTKTLASDRPIRY